MARDHGRRVPDAPAHVAHLLARALPRLPAQGHRRHQEARAGRARALHAELHVGRDQAQGPRGRSRDLGLQPLRQAPLHPLLQELHREDEGRPRDRGPLRVGLPAHQGPELLQRRPGRLLRQQGQQDQVADRQVPVPALRPRPDVGDHDRPHRGARRRGASRNAGHATGVRRRRVRRRPHARRDHRAGGRHLVAAPARDGRHHRSRSARARHRGGQGPALPRLPHGRARARRGGPLPRQLDLHPRARRPRRAHPELPLVEPVDGSRPGRRLRRPRVLRLQGRRAVDHGRRGPRRAGHARARAARPGAARAGPPRLRRARFARLPDVRRGLRRARRHHPRVARSAGRELPAGRAQRPAPLQQLRPLDAEGHARRRQRPHARRPRHLGGQRRELLPRGGDRRPGPAALQEGAGDPVDERGPGARAGLVAGRGRALLIPAVVSAIALVSVVWWASRQQLPELPSASVALPRLAAALALYALATCLRGERWLRLLRSSGSFLSRTDAYAVTVVGYMGNNALPARAGDVLKSVLSSRRAGTPTADGFGSLVAERVLDAVALVFVFAVLVTTLHLPLGVEGWMLAAVAGGLVLAAAAAAFLGRDTGAGRRLQELGARLLAPTRRLWSPTGAGLLALSVVLWLIEGFVYAVLGAGGGVPLWVVLWLSGGSVYAVLGAVAGVHLSLLDGLYIMALANLVALAPAAPGYLGTFDAAVLLGVRLVAGGTHAAALAYAVVVRFVLFVPITLVGLVALVVRYG